MPTRPARPCPRQPCRHLIDDAHPCPDHGDARSRRLERERARAPRTAAIYDGDWRRLRREVLRDYPGCQACGATSGLEVHHRTSIRERPDLRLERSNLVVLCGSCHAHVTASEGR